MMISYHCPNLVRIGCNADFLSRFPFIIEILLIFGGGGQERVLICGLQLYHFNPLICGLQLYHNNSLILWVTINLLQSINLLVTINSLQIQ